MYYDSISSGYIGILPEGPLVILVEVFEALKPVYLEVVLPHMHSIHIQIIQHFHTRTGLPGECSKT